MGTFRGLVAAGVATIGGWGLAPCALADGGPSIASAPAVVYGQQEFGNTASAPPDTNGDYNSYWALDVLSGDRVVVDWQGVPPDGFGVNALLLYAIGTTDYNLPSSQHADESDISANGRAELSFTANRTGLMPLRFYADESGQAGPYNFTAYVQHALVVSLSVKKVNRRQHNTAFVVGLHNPDGVSVSNSSLRYDVQHGIGGRWQTTSNAGPRLSFSYKWGHSQRGKWQYVRVRVHGSGYRTTTSRTLRVKGV